MQQQKKNGSRRLKKTFSSKVSDKIQLIQNMLDKVNSLIITGAMAFTFKKTLDNVKVKKKISGLVAVKEKESKGERIDWQESL